MDSVAKRRILIISEHLSNGQVDQTRGVERALLLQSTSASEKNYAVALPERLSGNEPWQVFRHGVCHCLLELTFFIGYIFVILRIHAGQAFHRES